MATEPAEPPRLIADVNEPPALVAAIERRGIPLELRRINPGDFLVGRVAFERKTTGDFFRSLVQKRLFDQANRLREAYECPALVLEGDLSYVDGLQNPGAFWGALASLTFDLGIPVLHTRDHEDTAALLAGLYRRELKEGGRTPQVRFKTPAQYMTLRDRQKFAVQGLPRVGDRLSELLLARFGSVRNVYRAEERDLRRVSLVGDKTARDIAAFLDAPFVDAQTRITEAEPAPAQRSLLEDEEREEGAGASSGA